MQQGMKLKDGIKGSPYGDTVTIKWYQSNMVVKTLVDEMLYVHLPTRLMSSKEDRIGMTLKHEFIIGYKDSGYIIV